MECSTRQYTFKETPDLRSLNKTAFDMGLNTKNHYNSEAMPVFHFENTGSLSMRQRMDQIQLAIRWVKSELILMRVQDRFLIRKFMGCLGMVYELKEDVAMTTEYDGIETALHISKGCTRPSLEPLPENTSDSHTDVKETKNTDSKTLSLKHDYKRSTSCPGSWPLTTPTTTTKLSGHQHQNDRKFIKSESYRDIFKQYTQRRSFNSYQNGDIKENAPETAWKAGWKVNGVQPSPNKNLIAVEETPDIWVRREDCTHRGTQIKFPLKEGNPGGKPSVPPRPKIKSGKTHNVQIDKPQVPKKTNLVHKYIARKRYGEKKSISTGQLLHTITEM